MAAPLEEILWKGQNRCRVEKLKVKKGSHVSVGSLLVICVILDEDENNQEAQSRQIERLKSSLVGTVHCLYVEEGQVIDPGGLVMTVSPCQHPTVMKDMCADCGADLRAAQGRPGERTQHAAASVAMVHNIPELHVSKEVALELAQNDTQSLLNNKKLVLIVDLDQTVIHTTMKNVHQGLPGVHHFQLLGSGQCYPWYHTKIRPGCKEFLEKLSEKFQLHIFTMGSRPYAHTVARILDPDKKLFSDRILSRDECFDPNSKTANLSSIFPTGDHMVCIIDDREDVWNFAPNLIHVKPYQYFIDTDDINIPPGLLPQENQFSSIPKADEEKTIEEKGLMDYEKSESAVSVKKDSDDTKTEGNDTKTEDNSSKEELLQDEDVQSVIQEKGQIPKETSETSKKDPLVDVISKQNSTALVSSKVPADSSGAGETMIQKEDGSLKGDDMVVKEESVVVKERREENTNGAKDEGQKGQGEGGRENQESERQEREEPRDQICAAEGKETDVKEEDEELKKDKMLLDAITDKKSIGSEFFSLSKDEDCMDDYLLYLEDILMRIHRKYFKVYDHFREKKEDFVPDIKYIIPSLRKKVLSDIRITFSAVFPRNLPPERYRLWNVAIALGAEVSKDFIPKGKNEENTTWTTHVIAAKSGTSKVHFARRSRKVHVVTPQWLVACWERWERVDERLYHLTKSGSSRNTSGSGRSTPASENDIPPIQKSTLTTKKQITIPEKGKAKEDVNKNQEGTHDSNSQQLPLSMTEDYNPLCSFSSQEIKDMDREVEDIFGESSSSNNSDMGDDDVSIDSPSGQSLGSITQELPSSSDESLTADSPRGWKRKREDSSSDSDKREEEDKEDDESNSPRSDDKWTSDEERDEMADEIDDLLTYSTTARSFSTHLNMPK